VQSRIELSDQNGERVGYIEGMICASEVDVDKALGFGKLAGGFAPYAAQIPVEDPWPVAVLLDLEVYSDFRRRGFGRAALRDFLLRANGEGAKIALLRVGWYGEDWEAERAWRISWYSREGFHELKNPSPKILIPFMYQIL
jgi:ribosomal protein S18 acetylase RimI-like enzyme